MTWCLAQQSKKTFGIERLKALGARNSMEQGIMRRQRNGLNIQKVFSSNAMSRGNESWLGSVFTSGKGRRLVDAWKK